MNGLNSVYAQSSKASPGKDIIELNSLLKRIHTLEDTDTKSAMALVKQAKDLSDRLKIDTLRGKIYMEEGLCNFYTGNYKRATVAFDSAAVLLKKSNQVLYLKALNDKANAEMYNSEYGSALNTFFECLDISNRVHNKKMTGQVLNNIGMVYESLRDPDNALLYEKRSLPYKMASQDKLLIARSYGNIGDAFSLKEMHDSAIYYEQLAYRLYASVNDKEGMSNSLGNIGNTYSKKKLTDSSISYLLRAVAISKTLSNAENNANFENNLAEAYLEKNDLKKTWQYASLAEAYAPQITDNEFLQEHYDVMYQYFKKTGNTAQAFKYLEKLNAVNDSVFKEKINIQNQKIAFEYEYKQKKLKDSLVFQTQLSASERKAAASRNRFIISSLLLLLAAALGVIGYSRIKLLEKKNIVAQQNSAMQEQKIRELETEKQILASQAVLKGQEDERSRLAKDLHDGLGGLLSGVKHSIINMKDNMVISSDNAQGFEKSLNMIDVAMKELRRVAQNMMPEALAKFGLIEALKDYCASSCTSAVKIVFQSFGSELKIDSSTEIIIYRIIQELVNNSLKHANASQVMVQLVNGDDWVTLSVEDNGKGFDVNRLKGSTGAGWSNIKSRVEYLGGNMDLKSQEGTGTSVNIEIKIPQA